MERAILVFNRPTKAAKLKPSQKLLLKAYDFFLGKLKERFPSPDGAGLAGFLENGIAPHLVFTTIEVSDEFSAYKVFETLNARGVKLSSSDLLKNYLFSIAVKNDSTDFSRAESLWQSISNKIGDGDLPMFIRYFWNSRKPFVRSAELYRTIRSVVKTQKQVFDFLQELHDVADLYVALGDHNNSIWEKDQRYQIKVLKMFRVSACHPLLMVAHAKLRTKEFTKLLREIVLLTFRRTIIGNLSTNELEPVFNRCSTEIYAGKATTAKKVHEGLKSLFVKDSEFQSAFSVKDLSYQLKKDVIRYILSEIENHHRKNHELQFDGIFTLEHIMPQTSSDTWEANFTKDEQEEYLNRLANFTPLEKDINERLKNDWNFAKKVSYCPFHIKLAI